MCYESLFCYRHNGLTIIHFEWCVVFLCKISQIPPINKICHLLPTVTFDKTLQKLISEQSLAPIQLLKTKYLGGHNPRLHSDEILIALSSSASMNPLASLAIEQLPKLRGAEAHSTVLLSSVDENMFRRLGIHLTCTPVYEKDRI